MLPDQREARIYKVLKKWCIFFNWNFAVFLCLPKESIEIAVDWFSRFQKGGQKNDGASSSPTCLSRRMKNESPAPSPISLEEKQNPDVRYEEEKQHTWLRALCCCCTSLLMSSFGRKCTWARWTEKKAWQKSCERKMQTRWDWKTYSSTEEEESSLSKRKCIWDVQDRRTELLHTCRSQQLLMCWWGVVWTGKARDSCIHLQCLRKPQYPHAAASPIIIIIISLQALLAPKPISQWNCHTCLLL